MRKRKTTKRPAITLKFRSQTHQMRILMALASSVDGQRLARRLSARPAAPSGESFDLRRLRPNDSPPVVSAARPPRARLVPLRFACSSNLLSVLLRRPGEQITSARVAPLKPLRGFSFSGRFAPSSQRVAAFRPLLRPSLAPFGQSSC